MRNFKGFIPTMTLVAIMLIGSTFAHAGLLVSDRSGLIVSDLNAPTRTDNPCGETRTDKTEKTRVNMGIIIGGNLAGIIIGGNLMGIIIGGNFAERTPETTNCGIIIGGN
ncbi:MAG: hypothetical protein KF855_14210 [Acidobacteria bacterium]|nr:hypothetical protein [Acidobacteriota bacterium]